MVERVFITGVGSISPVGLTIDETWSSLTKGVSGIDTISSFDSEGYETTIAAEATDFDPQNYLDRKQAKRMDRFVQLAAAASLEALEKSGLTIDKTNEERISVMVASGIGGIITLSEQIGVLNSRGPNRVSPFLVPMMLPDMASGQVSMLLGAKGANYCTVSACASGADSIGMAFEAIRRGDVDGAIGGGAEAAICPVGVAGFNACQALSKRNNDPQTASRPFDKDRDGFVLGEGAGVLVLENESSINARGAEPIAEMIGYGATADAYHITQPSEGGKGAIKAMNLAIKDARISPEDVNYINAHGTSTPFNDKTESAAISSLFGNHSTKLRVSSTKSMIGHALGASGALEAVACVKAIKENIAPPTKNYENKDPDCALNYVPNKAEKIQIDAAMSNSFGFGGHNAVIVFKKWEDS